MSTVCFLSWPRPPTTSLIYDWGICGLPTLVVYVIIPAVLPDTRYLDVHEPRQDKLLPFRPNITGIWYRPTNGEKKPSWRAGVQKKWGKNWIRRIPEWQRLEEEGNLRVRAFSQGWWLGGRGREVCDGRRTQFPLRCIFLSHFSRDRRQVGDRSSCKMPEKMPCNNQQNEDVLGTWVFTVIMSVMWAVFSCMDTFLAT